MVDGRELTPSEKSALRGRIVQRAAQRAGEAFDAVDLHVGDSMDITVKVVLKEDEQLVA